MQNYDNYTAYLKHLDFTNEQLYEAYSIIPHSKALKLSLFKQGTYLTMF